jgi:tetratricopeptide (TPR) repeat protein
LAASARRKLLRLILVMLSVVAVLGISGYWWIPTASRAVSRYTSMPQSDQGNIGSLISMTVGMVSLLTSVLIGILQMRQQDRLGARQAASPTIQGHPETDQEAPVQGKYIPRELPRGIQPFVDRTRAIAELDDMLAKHSRERSGVVNVVSGTAGVGKTSLVLHWAQRGEEHFPDGQLYINLRGYDPGAPASPDEALEQFLRSLGTPDDAIPAGLDQKAALFRSLIAGRRVLIVLDNAATVAQVRPLLPGTANALVLVTSRSRLSGLTVRDGATRSAIDVLTEQDAVELLHETTRDFRRGDDHHDFVELARLCAYLPLALRIAGERAATHPSMPLADLVNDLRDESGLWEALAMDDEDEASAVRSVFAWSYRALPSYAAQLFCLLGLHPAAGISTHAAAALAGRPVDRIRHPLDVLVGAHLLKSAGYGRYQFHDLLRAYASDQAKETISSIDQDAAIERECGWYLGTAHSCVSRIGHDTTLISNLPELPADVTPLQFSSVADASRWFDEERGAFVAVTDAARRIGKLDVAWQLAALLERIYASRHHFADWRTTSLIGLKAARAAGNRPVEALFLESLGRLARLRMRLDEAATFHKAAADAHLALGDRIAASKDFNSLSWVHLFAHELEQARAAAVRSLRIAEAVGDQYWIATASYTLGYTLLQLHAPAAAGPPLLAARRIFQSMSDRLYEALVLTALSLLERDLGMVTEALRSAQEAVDISREVGNEIWEATTVLYLGKAQRAGGRSGDALISYQRSAVISRQGGDSSREAIALEGAGAAYQDLRRFEDAIPFHRRAAMMHEELGDLWKLAKSLWNLANALDRTSVNNATDAARCRSRARDLLTAFTDPKSVARRAYMDGATSEHL